MTATGEREGLDRAAFTEEVISHLAGRPREWLEAHGFASLVLPPDETFEARRLHARRLLVAEDVLDRLVGSDSPGLVLMKGLEVAQLYPTPLHRPSRDLDLLAADPTQTWNAVRAMGFEPNPARRADIDHHHLPALGDPTATLGVEVHLRPNVPGWAELSADLVRATARPSRTGREGLLRPRDDVHALLMAMHAWSGGFTKLRDLFDMCLLAVGSEVPVERTARDLGLERCWRLTQRLARSVLLGEPPPPLLQRIARPDTTGIERRRTVRLVAPFVVAPPWRVAASHLRAARLARSARRDG